MEPQHNGSSNRSGPGEGTLLPYTPLETALILLAVLTMAFVTLMGNILVVMAVCTSRALRAPQNLFVVSLAVADILVATLIIPFSLANEVMDYWCFGNLWCRLYLSLDVLFCTSSIMHLCAISLDRYWAVTRAARYNLKRSPRRVKITIACIWVIAALVALPPLFKTSPEDNVCLLHDDTWYVLASCTASFFAPCFIMVAVYCRIYHVAKHRNSAIIAARRASHPTFKSVGKHDTRTVSTQQYFEEGPNKVLEHSQLARVQPNLPRLSWERRLEEMGSSGAGPCRTPRLSWSMPNCQQKRRSRDMSFSSGQQRRRSRDMSFSSGQQRRRSRDMSFSSHRLMQARERRFTFVLAFIIGAFVLCWFPFFFMYSLESVLGKDCCISRTLFKFFFWIGYCNSSFNPIIYTIFNRDFRKAFQHLLCQADPLRHLK
ncbi:alpha-2Da adrenergic receptor [Anolis carolinensis]|uniref:G-protein coupled receptors family 1 profile domain-containing protein n=1 Tax=Anolis carolinensis TaxID=28377 RepID=G1KF88_ANOCA|nr:PREDICTED: alpha-2Da adrenergic receptor [Anolis carolinensis]|eukprot:XP_003217630.1 PREDICTED: alpha-2Da adrenergic receptor [Anolis carolinensis]